MKATWGCPKRGAGLRKRRKIGKEETAGRTRGGGGELDISKEVDLTDRESGGVGGGGWD